ncbi:MAG: SUF system NifU family Fe-S cluster assembly protein [Erysipelotrichaceae bacterium]|nr:SUF system NifU family Fe-S cluster assembly protein [Erysipelotrichaceae bacterium]MDD3808668.1 SUF system NifU family Fe-S cluster assembly protein [Erysipelotrichaceae bacterium]
MPSFNEEELFKAIILDHYKDPRHHQLVDDSGYKRINMDSTTCIDNIDIQLLMDGDIIKDIRFDGESCAISTASTSIMTELLIGKTREEANEIIKNFNNMIFEKDYDPEILEEAIAFKNTHKQASRIKCATIGWNGIDKLLNEK